MATNTKHDVPALTNTVAARESTPVGEVSSHHASIKSRLPQSRRRSQSGTPSGRAGEPTDDYFHAPGPMKSRSHEDMRSASAASATSAAAASTHPTAPSNHPTAPSAPVPSVNLITQTDSTPTTPRAESAEPAESAEEGAAASSVLATSPGSATSNPMEGTTNSFEQEFIIGKYPKSFTISKALLMQMTRYFAALYGRRDSATADSEAARAATEATKDVEFSETNALVYKDMDVFAFPLLVKWLQTGQLDAPDGFHAASHIIELYLIATKFMIEPLRNQVIDVVRRWYRENDTTASPFRVKTIYDGTTGPNKMRKFLVMTAAYRALCGSKNPNNSQWNNGVSESMAKILMPGGEFVVDYAEALVFLATHDLEDPREGEDCFWHTHDDSPICPAAEAPEPWDPAGVALE